MTPIAAIEVQSLRNAMSQGQESVNELIRGPKQTPYQREEQVKRCEQALDLMKTELKNETKEQKNLILKATHDILEEARTDVLDQLRGGANERMKQLQEKIEQMRTRRTEEEKEVHGEKASAPSAPAKAAEAEAWLPHTWDAREWSGKQIATVSALTVGAIGVAYLGRKLWRWMTGSGTEQAQGKKSGWGSLIYWIPGIGLAALGLYAGHKMLMKFDKYAKMINGLEGKLKGMLPGSKEAEYGLSKEDYEKAEHVYKTKGEGGRKEISAIFGLKDGETSPQFEKFMKDMQEKYKVEVSRNGVNYVKASVALQNYEDDLGTALFELGKWVERHKFEVAVGAIIAARLNILQSILTSPLSIAKKAAEIGKTMLKWGINHPLLSLFLLGGSIIGLKKLKDNVLLPENLHQLSKACMNGELFMGVDAKDVGDAAGSALNGLKDLMNKIGEIGEQVIPWITKHLETLVVLISESVPEMVGMTPEELIAQNNEACMDALHHYLEMQLRGVRTSTDKRNEGRGDACEKAIQALEEYRITYLRTRCTDDRESDTTATQLRGLKTSLAALDITVDDTGEVVTWKSKDMPEAFDLCVHPSITDRAKLKALSERLRHGENFVNYWLSNALDKVREHQEQARKTGEKITENKGVAMVVGNFLYIFDDPFGNTVKYFMVPVDLAMDALGMNPFNMTASRDWSDWGVNVTGGAITSAAFSLNAAWIAKLKRMAIGGGPLYQGWKTRMIMNITPGLSQINMVRGMVKTAHDVKIIKMFGFLEGRRINNALAHANIRPEIIGIIETGSDADLMKVANEIGASLRNETDLVTKRTQLREFVQRKMRVKELRLKEVPGKLRTAKFWKWADAFKGKEIAYQDELYKMLMVKFAKAEDLMKVGHSATELLAAGAEMDDLLHATTHLDEAARTAACKELRSLGATADDFLKAGKDSAAWKAAGGAADDFTKAEKAAAGAAAKSAPKAPPPANPGAKAPAGTPAKAAAEGVEGTKALNSKLLALGPNADDAKILQVLREGGATEKMITKLQSSPEGLKLFKGAIATGQEAEVGKVMGMANKASKAVVALRMLGVGADVFAAYMAYQDLMDNELKIDHVKKTGNKELQKLYETTRIIHGTNLGVNTVAVVVGTLAFVSGVAATASVVLIPVALAISVGVEGWKQVEAIATDVYGTYKEYLNQTPANILVQLRQKSESDPRSFGSALYSMASWSDASEIGRQSGDSQIRELCKAYLVQTARLNPGMGESKENFKKRFDIYLLDAMKYVGRSGETSVDEHVFAKARIFADLCAKGRQAQSLGEEYDINGYKLSDFGDHPEDEGRAAVDERWKKKQAVVEQQFNNRHQELADGINFVKSSVEPRKELTAKTRIREMLLLSVEDDVNFLRRRLEETDYDKIGPGDSLHKRTAIVMASDMLRTELRNQSEALFKQPGSIRYEDVLAAQTRIRSILHTEPIKFQNDGIRLGIREKLIQRTELEGKGAYLAVIPEHGSEGFEQLEMSWLLDNPLPYKYEKRPLEQNEQISMGTKLMELKGGVLQPDGSYLFQGEGESMSVKLNGSVWAWSDTKSNTWQPAGVGLYENKHSSLSPARQAQRTEWNRIGLILKTINEKHEAAFWMIEKEVRNADAKTGTTIDQPLDVQLWNTKTSTPLMRRSQEFYFRLPFPSMKWQCVYADGRKSEVLSLNQTKQHLGEGSITDPGAVKIRFWLPSNPQNVYEVPIQNAA